MVGAILTAAHLYRQAADGQANRRGLRSRGGDAVEGVAAAEGAEALLRAYPDNLKLAIISIAYWHLWLDDRRYAGLVQIRVTSR